jgi:hypothetical protein
VHQPNFACYENTEQQEQQQQAMMQRLKQHENRALLCQTALIRRDVAEMSKVTMAEKKKDQAKGGGGDDDKDQLFASIGCESQDHGGIQGPRR